jgi:hypothetical protein
LGQNSERLELAGTNLCQRVGDEIEHEIDPAAQQILHRWTHSAVRNELEARARPVLKEYPGEVCRPRQARCPLRGLAWIYLEPGDEFLEIVGGCGVDDKHHRAIADEPYGREVVDHIVG